MNEEHIAVPIVVTQPTQSWKWQLVTFARQLGVAVLTSVVIVAGLVIGFHGQTESEVARQEDTLHANLAIACVLALPVDLDTGRDPDSVKLCFTQYQLQPPTLRG